MNGNQLVDEMLRCTGDVSDYALAKRIDRPHQFISNLRREKNGLSPEMARTVALIINEDPRNVLAWSAAWKSKDECTKKFWLRAAAGCLIAGVLTFGSSEKTISKGLDNPHFVNVYIMRTRFKRLFEYLRTSVILLIYRMYNGARQNERCF